MRAMYPYIERELSNGTYLGHITRHMLGLFRHSGARQWRRYLSENAHKAGADIEVWNTRCVWLRINVKFR